MTRTYMGYIITRSELANAGERKYRVTTPDGEFVSYARTLSLARTYVDVDIDETS